MTRATVLLAIAVLLGSSSARAEEGRFDAQVFRPSAAPRDLVMVQKSEVIGHLSPTVGIYQDLGFDPLVLLANDTGQTIEAVGARFQLTGLFGVGLFDWADLRLALPFVAWQTSDNLRSLGSEGKVQSTSVGDVRLTGRVAIPRLSRKDDVTRGFGMAVAGNINLPTGSVKAFAGDGVLTGGITLIGDYRFGLGALVTANLGVWLRPDRQFAGVRIGDMASVAVSGEAYVIQSWGLSVLGGVYGYPSLDKYPDSPRQIPAEVLMALRWQTRRGITITFGGSFGAACGFGAPALRMFNGITWQPSTSREQEQINRILEQKRTDPDGDGLIGEVDKCPEQYGTPENRGCPDEDRDGDGVVDREDECPEIPGEPGKKGCPVAFIRGDEIVILEKVYFATDSDVILDKSKTVLEAVAQVLLDHPEIVEVRVEGHTDVRASDEYNLELSQRRVNSVKTYLMDKGVVDKRLVAKGFGHSQPLYDDSACNKPDEELSEDCLFMTSQNRRVVFRITRRAGEKAPEPSKTVQDEAPDVPDDGPDSDPEADISDVPDSDPEPDLSDVLDSGPEPDISDVLNSGPE